MVAGHRFIQLLYIKGQREMCKFIADELENKNPEDDHGLTPQELMWNNVCGIDQN